MFTYCCLFSCGERMLVYLQLYGLVPSPPILLVLIGIVDFHLCARAPISL